MGTGTGTGDYDHQPSQAGPSHTLSRVPPHSLTFLPDLSSFLRGSHRSHHLFVANMLTHLFRGLSSRSTLFSGPTTVQTASLVIARRNREIAKATELTHDDTNIGDQPQTESNIGMEQITDILDNSNLSKSPQSDNFSGELPVSLLGSNDPHSMCLLSLVGTKYERVRKGRLPKGLHVRSQAIFFLQVLIFPSIQFLKPTDLLAREDPFRRKRALLGPGAAESRRNDWFYQLGIDPLDEATNPRLLSYFVTDMGKVKSRAETKLTWHSQRRLSKAIRRAKMMGVMPILNKQVASYRGSTLL